MTSLASVNMAGTPTASHELRALVKKSGASALAMATAFFSVRGAEWYLRTIQNSQIESVHSHVLVGVDQYVTHPEAIRMLYEDRHDIRIAKAPTGYFHPKMLVGGKAFDDAGRLLKPSCSYVGSANITRGGLETNTEVIMTSRDAEVSAASAQAFHALWPLGFAVSDSWLAEYEVKFGRAQRARSLRELYDVTDEASPEHLPMSPRAARAVWVGLESFTGGYAFQVEIPKRASAALTSILDTDFGYVDIVWDDGIERRMLYSFYEDNSMFRLNIPNEAPLVDWAREQKTGALLIWVPDTENEDDSTQVNGAIIRGEQLQEVVERSKALGTFGSTSTRSYGWF